MSPVLDPVMTVSSFSLLIKVADTQSNSVKGCVSQVNTINRCDSFRHAGSDNTHFLKSLGTFNDT